tara:strand:- start:16 stop:525 length:510 start_codon:yes stop_codon:yes gene_type:complete
MSTENSTQFGFDMRAYRDTLGCFATGVCVMLAEDEKGRVRGITANSFSSVSLHPPIILWSIDEHSDRFDLFVNAERFSVNILKAEHRDLSTRFAQNVSAELEPEQLGRGANNVPYFKSGLGHMICDTSWRQKAGDHVVIFGDVKAFGSTSGQGLGFFKGDYLTLEHGDI